MNFRYVLSTMMLASIICSACSSPPINPNVPIVLEQHKNISVEPETKHNLARLIKQKDNCLIEFTGNFASGKATEYWLFKNDQLISAFSNVEADVENKQTVFDPKEAEKQANFATLKKNFKQNNLDKCA